MRLPNTLTDLGGQIDRSIEEMKLVNPFGSGQPGLRPSSTLDDYDVAITVPMYRSFGGRIDFTADNQDFALSLMNYKLYVGDPNTVFNPTVHYTVRQSSYRRFKTPLPGDEKRTSHYFTFKSAASTSVTYYLKFFAVSTDSGTLTPGTWSTFLI